MIVFQLELLMMKKYYTKTYKLYQLILSTMKQTNLILIPTICWWMSYQMVRILQKIGFNIAFYSLLKIWSLSKLKDPVFIWDRCGGYRIECRDFISVWIRQTGHGLPSRIMTAHRCPKNKSQDPHFAEYLLGSGQPISFILDTSICASLYNMWSDRWQTGGLVCGLIVEFIKLVNEIHEKHVKMQSSTQ